MGRVPHSWREAYASALRESDPSKLIGRIEYAITAIERRHSEWGTDPGTPAELTAIQACISALMRLMKQKQLGKHCAVLSTASSGSSNATERSLRKDGGQATLSLLVSHQTLLRPAKPSARKPTQ
jgi:hypothetical protein